MKTLSQIDAEIKRIKAKHGDKTIVFVRDEVDEHFTTYTLYGEDAKRASCIVGNNPDYDKIDIWVAVKSELLNTIDKLVRACFRIYIIEG